MRYRRVCVAGTFDGLHAGHEALLRKAFAVGNRVLIGLTSDAYVEKYKSYHTSRSTYHAQEKTRSLLPNTSTIIREYPIRKQQLVDWLKRHKYSDRVVIVPIDDPFGPAVSDSSLDALVVSEESKKRGEELNVKRKEQGLPELVLLVVPMVEAEDKKPISASRVRNGEIDASGRLTMPDSLRDELARPLGSVIHGDLSLARLDGKVIITVGDITTKAFLDAGITPSLMIVDYKVNRQKFAGLRPMTAQHGFHSGSVISGPGYIAYEAIRMLQQWFDAPQTPYLIEVDGEEDLLALPVIAEAPIGSAVYYGQPSLPLPLGGHEKSGVVEVIVTSDVKNAVKKLLAQFVQST